MWKSKRDIHFGVPDSDVHMLFFIEVMAAFALQYILDMQVWTSLARLALPHQINTMRLSIFKAALHFSS